MTNQTGPSFRDLVLQLKADMSYEAIEKRAGGTPTARSLQKLIKNGFTRMPDAETIRGLARALEVSQRELVLAAARTLGMDVEDESPNNLLLVGAGKLPNESQELLRATSRELQRWQDRERAANEGKRHGNVTPMFAQRDQERMAADEQPSTGDQDVFPESP